MDSQESLSHREVLDFLDDAVRRQAAGFAADEGDDTVGAAKIAAVLDFESWAGVVGFAAKNGSRKEFVAVEDVSSEDLSEMRRNILRPYEGMKRDSGVGMQSSGGEEIV